MNRRALLTGLMGVAASRAAHSAGGIVEMTPEGPLKRAFVQPQIVRQECPEWCWAASSSMIFAMHRHPVDQKNIVARVFGGLACMSGQNITVAAVLSSQWLDDFGKPFSAKVTAAYDYQNQINTISNRFIVGELLANRQLLYGNSHHAMVVSQVDYFDTPTGPNIQSVSVLDPWPGYQPFHPLSQPEMIPAHMGGQMNFLAAVNIW